MRKMSWILIACTLIIAGVFVVTATIYIQYLYRFSSVGDAKSYWSYWGPWLILFVPAAIFTEFLLYSLSRSRAR